MPCGLPVGQSKNNQLRFHCPGDTALKRSRDFPTPHFIIWDYFWTSRFQAQGRALCRSITWGDTLVPFWEQQCWSTLSFLLQHCSLLLPSFNCTAFPWANINDRTNSSANWKGYFPVIPRRAQLFQSIILPWLIDIRRSAKYITWFFFKYNRRHFKPHEIWLGWNSA